MVVLVRVQEGSQALAAIYGSCQGGSPGVYAETVLEGLEGEQMASMGATDGRVVDREQDCATLPATRANPSRQGRGGGIFPRTGRAGRFEC